MKPNIDYVSVLDDIKDIEERNKAFHKLNKQSKRLEIAWDALKLLTKNVIRPSHGWYWNPKLRDVAAKTWGSEDLQTTLNQNTKIRGCSVCARGGIMLSQIRLGNSISVSDPAYQMGSRHNLNGFSMTQMKQMENEYEHSLYYHPYGHNTREKLMNILCNVLVNGKFDIKDKTNYLIP